MKQRQQTEAPEILKRIGHSRSPAGNVAILRDALPDLDDKLVSALADDLKATGAQVCFLDAAQIANPFVLSPDNFDILMLTNAPLVPVDAVQPIVQFLRGGGDLIAIGTPAFERMATLVDGRWVDADGARQMLATVKPEKMLSDFETQPPGWVRAANDVSAEAVYEISKPGADATGGALHARIENLTGWDNISWPGLQGPFALGQTLTCFWAKGDKRTTMLAVEWAEADGSRWIATIGLTPEWQHYVLGPEQFAYWHDSSSKGRGGAGDRFNPANASRLSVGLAFTHTGGLGGPHEWWVDQLGTARNPYPLLSDLTNTAPPALDTLSPKYKFYSMADVGRVRVSERQSLVARAHVPEPSHPVSSHVRPQGTGCQKGRLWRWVPLIEATDSAGRRCGFPATLLVNAAPPYSASVWAVLSYSQQDVLRSKGLRSAILQIAAAMLRGVFLLEGGSNWYTYFDDQKVTLGATVANFGRARAEAAVRIRVTGRRSSKLILEQTYPITLPPGRRESVRLDWDPQGFPQAPYQVEVALLVGSEVIDSLRHEINVWRPQARRQYMAARDYDFYLGDKKWYPHGVNYMPSSGIATEDGQYFEYWIGPEPYDPDVIDVDLARIRSMGMNMVSVFAYHRSLGGGNLLDLLRRCQAAGLWVNLSLRPGTPLDFQWDAIKALIETCRLKDHDNVFAYDLAWEPMWGRAAERRRWDGEWERWIVERYGSIENAERDWGCPCPREIGRITGPSDKQVSEDGPCRVMVAAYRMFLDCLLSRKHSDAARLVRGIDPNHLVSFRMTLAGDPTVNPASVLAYDFRGLAKSMDIMCPEGYGRIGGWDRVRPGDFTVAYSRLAAPGRPVMWAEFGLHIWDDARMEVNPQMLQQQADFYELFFKMMLESGSTGGVCWWYPGGYRVGERSDYGIINPDGTFRPVSKVIKRYAPIITRNRTRPQPDVWLTVDRDRHADGLYGIYKAAERPFWAALDAGKFPGLQTSASGKTSADVAIVAVGNVPYTGSNPPKYLNAEFNEIQIRDAKGQWRTVRRGETLEVAAGRPVVARASIGNIGEVTWLGAESSAGKKGLGALSSRVQDGVQFAEPIVKDVPPLGDAEIAEFVLAERLAAPAKVVFEMTATGRAWFGEKIDVTLVPVR